MEPFTLYRSAAGQVAEHFVRNIDEIGPRSIKELCVIYNVGPETARNAMRLADGLLVAQGRTLTVPDGRDAWRMKPTKNEMDLAITTRTRMTAMMREIGRYRAKGEATSERDPSVTRAFGDCYAALELAVEALVGFDG